MRFPYLKTPTSDLRRKWISRPIVPVTIFGPKGNITVDALIDSGADKCLFNAALGREIGLNSKEGQKETFGGIEGGQIVSFVHKIQLQLLGTDEKIEALAGFADSPGIVAILGQEGFFDAYRIKFERDHNIVEIMPIKKKK